MTSYMPGCKIACLTRQYGLEEGLMTEMENGGGRMGQAGATPTGAPASPMAMETVLTLTGMVDRATGGTLHVTIIMGTSVA